MALSLVSARLIPAFAMLFVLAPPAPAPAPEPVPGHAPALEPAPAPEPSLAAEPVRTCGQAASAYSYRRPIPGSVDGGRIGGAQGLLALRAERGAGMIVVKGGDLTGADFRGAKLGHVCFLGTKLAGSDWRGAEAAGLVFSNVDLTGARLADAKMRNVGFWSTNLTGANLAGAKMRNASFGSANLTGVDASRADLSGGSLSGNALGSISRLTLDGADLTGFRFECGITQENNCGERDGISFRDANLAGASVDLFLNDADWTGARFDRTHIMPEQLLELGTARLVGPLLVRGDDPANVGPLVAALSPAEYARMRPHLRAVDSAGGENGREAGAHRPRPKWLRPGARALFLRPRIEFDAIARAGTLYARLLPVLIRSAYARLMVEVNADGSIHAGGGAVGGNGHQCDVGGDKLRLDRATGWYSGPYEPFEGSPPNGSIPAFPADPPEWRNRPMPVLRFRGDRVEVYEPRRGGSGSDDPRMSDYVSCGARAGFDEMMLVPSDSAEARRLWAEATVFGD